MHLLLDEEARPGAAHLSGTEEHAEEGPLHGGIEIGVAEDNVGRLAPELEGDALQCARRLAVNLLPHLGRAGEGDLVDQGMVDERAAGRRSEAGDDVDYAGRNPGFEQELPQTERGERRLLGGLQHGGVAAGKCGRELPGTHEEREVPGDDLPAHSHRLAQGEVEEGGVRGVRLAVEFGHPAGVVTEGLGGGRDVDVPALRERLPVVERLELRQLVAVLLDQVGDPEQQTLAVVEGSTRRPHGAVDVLLVALRDPRQHLSGGGVERLERLARRRLDPLAVDQHLPHRCADEALHGGLELNRYTHGESSSAVGVDGRIVGSPGRAGQ